MLITQIADNNNIIVNVLEPSPAHHEIFLALLRRMDANDRACLSRINNEYNGITVQLSHRIVCRKSNSRPGQYRYEVLSNNDSVMNSAIYDIIATIEILWNDKIAIKTSKSRLIKSVRTNTNAYAQLSRFESSLTRLVPHLHSKDLSIYNREASRGFITMYKMPGMPLNQLLYTDFMQSNMTIRQRLDLTYALMKAYQSQVANRQIAHRDLKGANVIIAEHGYGYRAYFIDFGLSTKLGHDAMTSDVDELRAGNFIAKSPERFFGGASSELSEVYGLGILISRIWRSNGLFGYSNQEDCIAGMKTDKFSLNEKNIFCSLTMPDTLKTSLMQLLNQMIAYNPLNRPTVDDTLEILVGIRNQYVMSQLNSFEEKQGYFNAQIKARTYREDTACLIGFTQHNLAIYMHVINETLVLVSDDKESMSEFIRESGLNFPVTCELDQMSLLLYIKNQVDSLMTKIVSLNSRLDVVAQLDGKHTTLEKNLIRNKLARPVTLDEIVHLNESLPKCLDRLEAALLCDAQCPRQPLSTTGYLTQGLFAMTQTVSGMAQTAGNLMRRN